jgi:hypothetical protein
MTQFSDEERERRKARYFWDSRRKTDDPETEGYGYDFEQMFRDLEIAEHRRDDLVKALEPVRSLLHRVTRRVAPGFRDDGLVSTSFRKHEGVDEHHVCIGCEIDAALA